MDASSLTPENIGAMAGVFAVAAYLAAKNYLKQRQAPPPPTTSDVYLPGVGIADMRPAREGAASLEKIAAAQGVLAEAMVGIGHSMVEVVVLMKKRQEDIEDDREQALRDQVRDLKRLVEEKDRAPRPRRSG